MNIDIIDRLLKDNGEPNLFENSKTQEDFWDNEHISKMMLMAHLNPDKDTASRKSETIEASVNWIIKTLSLNKNHKLLDLGCGPGLYCTKFADHGLKVTGIDYSKRSVEYAIKEAALRKQALVYRNMNYLELDYDNEFDVIVLIYCDFGVLSKIDRVKLLNKMYRALKVGGHIVFDVWSTAYETLSSDYKNWIVHKKQGFWKAKPHLELIQKKYYLEAEVSLKQHIIIEEENNFHIYNLWEQCYTIESITQLMASTNFQVIKLLGDLTGKDYSLDSNSIGIIAKKIE